MASSIGISLPFTILILCLYSINSIKASIHDYTGQRFISKGNAFVLHGGSEGLYASSPSSRNVTIIGHEDNAFDSFIGIEKITFRRPKESAKSSSGLIQVIVFEVEDREMIGGSAYGGQRDVCCTSDLAKLGLCKQGEVILRPSTKNPNWPKVSSVSFNGDDLVSTFEPKFIGISRTGMYNLYFIHCDPSLEGLVVEEGKSVWKNPSGYLPGRMAPLMKFYGFMCIGFFVLGVFWFSQYARYWNEVLQLQNCISLVIALGMCETASWYIEYAVFNKIGIRPTLFTICAVTFGTVKRTIARIILLIVSMGYGVVRPTLGGLTLKVVMLGGTFFLATEVLELVENVGTVSDLSGKTRIFLVLPVAILDAFFIIWIFTSLSTTLNKLQARRMMAKLDIYRKFTNSLAVAVIVSVGWICYELNFKAKDVYNERWQSAWIIPAFWQVLSFSLLCVICALWAPSQNAMRYAYSDEGVEEFDSDDSLTLIKSSQSPSKDVLNTTEDKDRHEHKNDESHEDLEEDKRE